MKSIKEKQLLVKWSRVMNEPVDATLVEEVERYNILQNDLIESVRNNSIKDLAKASAVVVQSVEKVNIEYPKPPTLDEVLGIIQEETKPIVKEVSVKEPETTLADAVAEHITKEVRLEQASFQQPNPPLVDKNFEAVQRKLKFLEQAIGKIATHGPGSGSYWLYDLGDTNYNSVKSPNNEDVLIYNTANAKWEAGISPGAESTRYHASYYDTTTQTANAQSTGYFVKINTVDQELGFTNDGANIIATYTGTYNFQFSLQLHRTGGGGSGDTVEIWLTKNGADVANTNTILHVGSNNPYAVPAWNFVVDMNANDKVALKWGTKNTNIVIEANGHTIGPSVPSSIITIVRV